MMPYIDPSATATSIPGGTMPLVKRPEVEKVLEVYQPQPISENVSGTTTGAAEHLSGGSGGRSETDRIKKAPEQDQAELKMQFTREERDAFLNAMSGRESVSEMSEDEQDVLQKAAERIDRLIEEAGARDTQSRERVDKAVKEWYVRLSNGRQPPGDLLSLIRQAAAGTLE